MDQAEQRADGRARDGAKATRLRARRHDPVAQIEHTAIFGASALALALTGPGSFSVDAALGIDAWWTPWTAWLAVGVAIPGAGGNLAARRSPSKERSRPSSSGPHTPTT